NKEEIHENKEQQVKQTTIASTKHESQVDTKSKDEQSTVLLVNFFDKIFSNAKQETRNLLLQNVILCGGSVTSDMVITLNNHLSKYNNVKIILDHTIFSTFTGMDILAINLKGFITRKEWEEFGDKSIEKFGIEWYK
ncbi:putative actin, partial [Pseudoloma neurophilia]